MPFPPPQAAQSDIPQPINPRAKRPPPRKNIMSLSLQNDVQLPTSKKARKPRRNRKSLPAKQGAQGTQDLFKKVCSILNELTPQNFSQVMKQVTSLTIETEEQLIGVTDLVFEKAIDEPILSAAYGNMCRCLATLKVPITDEPGNTVSFLQLLLSRCRKEFYKEDEPLFRTRQKELDSAASVSTDRERLQKELQEARDIIRRRSVGNIKFIGELYKHKMLKEPAMHDCVINLLTNYDDDSLESLCSLLNTIGKEFDLMVAKRIMDKYFHQMQTIVTEGKTSSRIQFMLKEIIDLRLHNWVSKRPDQGLKTITKSHKEANIEKQEEQRKVQVQPLSKVDKSPEFAKPINLEARRPPPRKNIMSLSLQNDVQLPTSKKARKPRRNRKSLPAKQKAQGTQDLFEKVCSILNELTPQNFSQVMKQVTSLTIETEEQLKGVTDLVFEKAIDDPILSAAYGNMCRCLATLKVPITDEPGNTVSFLQLLLSRCRKEFYKEDEPLFRTRQKELDSAASVSTDRERLQKELQEARDIIRRRSVGNIKFIGELYKHKMLKEPAMHDCVINLLTNYDDDSLESLCSLLNTIGKEFDLMVAKRIMDKYFHQMQTIVTEGKTSSRIQFMLKEIIDLRLEF
ncbi:eukaryotic translation initiation factor 4 gamma 3-like [Platichthys flesus]|uniref:eukaryotic translation initiation factor 4 gamma 3-like n=1 Tax=Platichthys flesus TaxID=8260 RepID=UPI002DB9D22D|nr:eukaryotic translation initiation factor 4 gamma 3-like [Platichthys flesus]